ncbi:glycosyltransferase, partial [Morganella morganii]
PNEVIIVHDGKLTSELYSVIEKWEALLPIQNVILDNNCGLGIALNIGLEQCSNDIVMRADTDDINLPNRFEIQYKYMTQNPEITLCGSHVNEFEASSDEIIRVKKVPIGDNIVKVIKKRNPFNHMAVCFRKKHIINVGGYMDLPYMEDYYLWLRLLNKNYNLVNLDTILVSARVGEAMIN